MSLVAGDLSIDIGGREIIARASLKIAPGEFVALLGPNGAGKTTLVRALCGVIESRGNLDWNGNPIAGMTARERARTIAYLPQGHVSHWPMRVSETVAIGRYPHASSLTQLSESDDQAITNALAAVDALHLSERDITTLSGGERARVLLARALAVEAPVLLADEPIAALDPRHQLAMAELLCKLAREGRAILTVMHDLTLASRFADRVIVMKDGAIVADGSPAATLTDACLENVFAVTARRLPAASSEEPETVIAWTPSSPAGR